MALDGYLGPLDSRRDSEHVFVERLDHLDGQCSRTAATIVYLRYLATVADVLCHHVDLLVQCLHIGFHHLGLSLRIGVATTVVAQMPAEGDMQIE